MRLLRILALLALAVPVVVALPAGHVAAFCEILEPPSDVPTQVNGTHVEIQLTEGFARVVIVKEFYNPGDFAKEGQVFFPLERGHELITDLSLKIGNVVYNSTAQDRGDALDGFLDALANGKDAALVQYDPPRDVYWVAVTIPPREARTTITTLEMPLAERDGFYTYDYRLSVDAGHSVSYLRVHARVETSASLAEVQIPSHPELAITRDGDRVAHAFVNSTEEARGRDLQVRFRSSGLTLGQWADADTAERYVRLSVDADDPVFGGSLRPLPRSFLLLLDASGSMGFDGRLPLAKAAAMAVLQDLKPGETFAVVAFGGPAVHRFSYSLRSADPQVLADARAWLDSLQPRGSTAYTRAFSWIDRWAAEARAGGQQPVLFLVSDGRPTTGPLSLDLENSFKRLSFERELPVLGVAVKPRDHADETVLHNLSHFNHGAVVALHDGNLEPSMASALASIRVPVLQDVAAEFPGAEGVSFASENPQDILRGGEAVVIARMNGAGGDALRARLTWRDTAGTAQTLEGIYDGGAIPVQPLLRKQWVLARIHWLLDAVVAKQDPALLAELKEIATANRVVTPYTSLLVAIPSSRTESGPPTSSLFDLGGTTFLSGPRSLASGRSFPPSPLAAVGQEADAFRTELANPLIADHEIDRYVVSDSPAHQDLLLSPPLTRFEGRFVTILEVDGELVAIVRGWLDPAVLSAKVQWSLMWALASGLALWALVRVGRAGGANLRRSP